MKAIDALLELLERVGACWDIAVLVNDEELLQWPGAAVKAMRCQKLIVRARPASSAICPGCESNCVMPVHTPSASAGKPSSFIVCDKRSDINRVPVSPGSLNQWQCNVDLVTGFIAYSLGLRSPKVILDSADRREIGIVSGDKRSQMLCLETSGALNLVIGNSKAPLAEFIEFHKGTYTLDAAAIRRLADSASTADERYTPSNARREARKLDTQVMYESWRKEYRALRKKRPHMSDVWYAQQIAKSEIAQGREAETIRRRMKVS
ncbi:MAG TPA: hypothetical protein PKM59_15235 [Thermodesulfobacteriota bacterium]|nr:hypothetical protein [Thermodesulfobacteriota bacterium]